MPSNFSASPQTTDSFARPTAGQGLDSPDQAALVNLHSDAIEAIEGGLLNYGLYAPAANGNGLTTFTSTWGGLFQRIGRKGCLWLGGEIKANWAGSGFLSIPLPTGWTGGGVESVGACWGNPVPVFGTHWTGIAIVHAAATEVRFIADTATYVSTGWPGYCTATAATDLLSTGTAHGLVNFDRVAVGGATSSGAAAGLTIGSPYYVISSGLTPTTFKVSATPGGSAVNIVADGTAWVAKQTGVKLAQELPIDGVLTPGNAPFTGDGTTANDDKMYVYIEVSLA